MINKYEQYKDSEVEWIGEIPDDWTSVRLKWVSKISKGKKPKVEYEEASNEKLPYLSMEYLRGQTNSPSYADPEQESLLKVDEGDHLILWDGSKAGEIVTAKKGFLSSTMAKIGIQDKRFVDGYLNYLLQIAQAHIQANTIGMGIPHVSGTVLKDVLMLIPTTTEQTKIAQYLDHQTGLIDSIIKKKQQLIEKLKEQRQAIINEAVTKGLNANAPMKDSGVEWLGKIPEHWEVVKLKYQAKVNPSQFDFKLNLKEDDSVSLLPMEKVSESWGFDKNSVCELGKVKSGLTSFQNGDILIAKITPCFENGKGALVENLKNKIGFGSTEFHVIRSENINKEFLFFVTRADIFMTNGESFMTGSAGQKRVPTSFVNNFPVPTPPVIEQEKIVDFLNRKLNRIEIIIKKNYRALDNLKLFRQSIISEAVTGKIDVREWEPKTAETV